MDIFTQKKLWVSLIALSLILGGNVAGTEFTAHAQSLNSSSSAAHHPHLNKRRPFPIINEAAPLLGLTVEELTEQLSEGKSILDIAKIQGVSEAALMGKLLTLRSQKIDQAVKAGKITQTKADQIKARMEQHLSYMLNSKHLLELQSKGHLDNHNESRKILSPEKLASLIGISEDQLIEQLKSGKSIAEIAGAQGISKQQLLTLIKDQLTPYLEKAIEHHSTTAPKPAPNHS